jgi:alkylhydroperoxidase family enzyme
MTVALASATVIPSKYRQVFIIDHLKQERRRASPRGKTGEKPRGRAYSHGGVVRSSSVSALPLQPRRTVTDPLVRVVFSEIESEFGFELVPNVFRVMSATPEILDAHWCHVRAALLRGNLDRKIKDMIGLMLSVVRASSSSYTRALCLQSLTRRGVDLDILALLVRGEVQCHGLTKRETGILRFARAIALRDGKVRDEDYVAIYDVGITFPETLEIASVVELFTSIARFAEVARVPVDLW